MSSLQSASQQIIQSVSRLVLGKEAQIKLALTCLLAKGHLLIEDLPGMGKTTLSHALAASMQLSYNRIQFTADLLPADILGVSIFKADTHEFIFHPGPVFNQVILADEINRASPKTQSALLEAMAEQQVSVDGKTYPLAQPFFVIATQNPLYQAGTHPLPESQLDRFLMRLSLGFPSIEAELTLLKQSEQQKIDLAELATINLEQLAIMQQEVEQVHTSDELLHYILKLVNESRYNSDFPHPLSPRASQAIVLASKAWAYIEGKNYVTADHVQAVFPAVTEHRLAPAQHNINANPLYSHQLLNLVDPN